MTFQWMALTILILNDGKKTALKHRWFLWIMSVIPISNRTFLTSNEAMKFTKSLLGHGALGMFGVRFCLLLTIDAGLDLFPKARSIDRY